MDLLKSREYSEWNFIRIMINGHNQIGLLYLDIIMTGRAMIFGKGFLWLEEKYAKN